ncbi:glutathione peroxidase [Methylophaga marina]|uniref:Glutathione peroxidase n=1 Tax=Methylophaga marina TaxID=45495 RepID=A0ABP3DI18_9GAMM|nr:glutathione peroxidase [Methylophaga marina]BDZ73694.1 glutathione peroxidase [Methylophaga marina]
MNNSFKAGLLMMVASTVQAKDCPQYMDYDLPKLHSNDTVNLCEIAKDKTLLVVNTASHCGYTRQFGGLESLHQQYQDKGLVVIGFASNDFDQEAKTEVEAARICKENFGVSFTMVAPSYVTGSRANPVFREINQQSQAPDWNFNKYIVDADGQVVKHFASSVEPDDPELLNTIDSTLSKNEDNP